MSPTKFAYPREATNVELINMWKNRCLCDVKLKVDDGEFEVHKIMVAAAIPFFNALYSGNHPDRLKSEIELPGHSSRAMSICLSAVYEGNLLLDKESIFEVLALAHYLHMSYAVSCCGTFISSCILSTTNAVHIWKQAELYKMDELSRCSEKFIFRHFELISKMPDFLQLEFDGVKHLVASDNLECKTEREVLDAIIGWISHSPERETYFLHLLECVRYGLDNFTLQDIADVWNQQVFSSSECNQKWLRDVMQFKLLPDFERANKDENFNKVRGKLCLIITNQDLEHFIKCTKHTGFLGISLSGKMSLYDFGKDLEQPDNLDMRSVRSVLHGLEGACSVKIGSSVYKFGGQCPHFFMNDTMVQVSNAEMYNFTTQEYKILPPMKDKRAHACAFVTNDNSIVVVGGQANNLNHPALHILESFEVFNIKQGTWTHGTLFEALYKAASCSHNGIGYVSGGIVLSFTTEVVSPNMHKYCVSERTWQAMVPMNLKRFDHDMCSIGEYIYVFGGYQHEPSDVRAFEFLNHLEQYSVSADQWTVIEELPGLFHQSSPAGALPTLDLSTIFNCSVDMLSIDNQRVCFLGLGYRCFQAAIHPQSRADKWHYKLIIYNMAEKKVELNKKVLLDPTNDKFTDVAMLVPGYILRKSQIWHDVTTTMFNKH